MSSRTDLGPPDERHPNWCSPAECTAPDNLIRRELVADSIPVRYQDRHSSERAVLPARAFGDISAEVRLLTSSDYPIEESPPHLELILVRTDMTSVEAYQFDLAWQVQELATMLADKAAVMAEDARRRAGTAATTTGTIDPGEVLALTFVELREMGILGDLIEDDVVIARNHIAAALRALHVEPRSDLDEDTRYTVSDVVDQVEAYASELAALRVTRNVPPAGRSEPVSRDHDHREDDQL